MKLVSRGDGLQRMKTEDRNRAGKRGGRERKQTKKDVSVPEQQGASPTSQQTVKHSEKSEGSFGCRYRVAAAFGV